MYTGNQRLFVIRINTIKVGIREIIKHFNTPKFRFSGLVCNIK